MATATSPRPEGLQPTYSNALRLLSLLQSNKTVVNLFADKDAASRKDINAPAIPEMRAWLQRAGYSTSDLAKLQCVHVAGTKGKGSVCTMLTSILCRYPKEAGFVGTYTSPHLVSVRERICLDGRPISQALFTKYFFDIWNRLSDASRRDGSSLVPTDELGHDGPSTKPFYFRFLTLMAFHTFVQEGVRSAVIECGIGGEYDSTNVLPAEALTTTVITQLGIDHVAMLGDTVEKIAWHKAGIFKHGVPAVTRRLKGQEAVMAVLEARASEKQCELIEIVDADVEKWSGVPDARMEGDFQKHNMALAAVAATYHLSRLCVASREVDKVKPFGSQLGELPEAFVSGLRDAQTRGRCQVIASTSLSNLAWYLDGAHTEDSLQQVGRWFAGKMREKPDAVRILVFNQQDRNSVKLLQVLWDSVDTNAANGQDIEKMASFQPAFHHVFCSTNDADPATENGEIRDLTVQRRNAETVSQKSPGTQSSVTASVSEAMDLVANLASTAVNTKATQVLVTGSFNLVGPLLRLLESDHEP